MRTRPGPVSLGCLAVVAVIAAGCSAGTEFSREQAEREGWQWGLLVEAGSVTCDRGISGPEVGFKADGSSTLHALSSNAIADARAKPGESDYTYATLGDIWDGTSPFRPFLDEAWRTCGIEQGAPDYEAEAVMGNAYQAS